MKKQGRKAKQATEGQRKPSVLLVPSNHSPFWYWRNRHGRLVHMSMVPDWGILKIMRRLDDEGLTQALEIVEDIARQRGLIDASGRVVRDIPAPVREEGRGQA